jgi:hypothetical protein
VVVGIRMVTRTVGGISRGLRSRMNRRKLATGHPILLKESVDNEIGALRYHPQDVADQQSCRSEFTGADGGLCLILRPVLEAF